MKWFLNTSFVYRVAPFPGPCIPLMQFYFTELTLNHDFYHGEFTLN
jgi:hypothetical protein